MARSFTINVVNLRQQPIRDTNRTTATSFQAGVEAMISSCHLGYRCRCDAMTPSAIFDREDETFGFHTPIRDNSPQEVKGLLTPYEVQLVKVSLSPMTMRFRDALLSRVGGPSQPSLRAVCEAVGVSYEQLKKLKQRDTASTNADDAVKIAAYFGLTLNEFIADDLTEDRLELARLYAALSAEERQFLRAAAAGQRALDRQAD
ncbi:hypothetical protein [Thioclava sp. GXIMD4215]|uniref:hypothetical protein n=1 Tax=Thioclava sp. GXIMD4215 TaxID=3131928 RepID=UPI0032539AA3